LDNALPIGYFWDANYDFWERLSSPKNGNILGYLLLQQFFTRSPKISSFKVGLVPGIFRFQKWFYVNVLVLQIEL
jgi:hypothetical protein